MRNWAILLATFLFGLINPASGEEASVITSLRRRVTLVAEDQPLDRIIATLAKQAGVSVRVDPKAIASVKFLRHKTKLDCHLANVTLASAIDHLLRERDLQLVADESGLLVTQSEQSAQLLTTVIDTAALLPLSGVGKPQQADYEELSRLVMGNVTPDSWQDFGGPGTLHWVRGRLIVRQSPAAVLQLHDLLKGLREAKQVALAAFHQAPTTTAIDLVGLQHDVLFRQLDEKVSFDFGSVSLKQLARKLYEKFKLSIVINWDSVGYVLANNTLIAAKHQNVTLDDALRNMLQPHGLFHAVRSEAVVVSADDLEFPDLLRAYPIADLLGEPIANDRLDGKQREFDGDDLADIIAATITPNDWEDAGGPCSISLIADWGLVIVAEKKHHDAITKLLGTLRGKIKPPAQDAKRPRPLPRDRLRLRVYTFATPGSAVQHAPNARPQPGKKLVGHSSNGSPTNDRVVGSGGPTGPTKASQATSAGPAQATPKIDPFGPAATARQRQIDTARDNERNPLAPPPLPGETPSKKKRAVQPQHQPGNANPFGSDPFGQTPARPPAPTSPSSDPPALPTHLPIGEDEFLQIILRTLDPPSWNRPGIVAERAHGRITIRHTGEMHRKISELADQLRIKDFRYIGIFSFGRRQGGIGDFGGGGIF